MHLNITFVRTWPGRGLFCFVWCVCACAKILFGSNIVLICWLHLHVIFQTQLTCTKVDELQEGWRNYIIGLMVFTSNHKILWFFG